MHITTDERLARLCADFSVAKIGEWLEQKFAAYDTSRAGVISVAENKNDKEYFKGARLLGYVRELPDAKGVNRPLLVAAVEMRKILTERTSRQAQFNFAKRILQDAVRSGAAGLNGYPSQGLFFFYDQDQFFRISLVSGEMDGRKFKFNEAKRQSFYVNPDRPNNIAKARLSESLETFSKLKDAFSVETLTKEFYGKLFDWYEWAMKPTTGVTFPNDDSTPDDDSKYNNESIIRLITRLMFTWFIRQRDMVQSELFTVDGVKSLLKSFDPKSMEEDNYYRCILQNLFFATFNCQPGKRGFIKHRQGSGYSDQHNVKTLYRYEKEFKDSDAFKALLKKTPFLNCALFDCLDKQQREVDGGKRLLFDGFSDSRKRQAHVPNGLFFHPEKGIIRLFDTYEFTIDENNADDADVALDPELLGKVFENLLGAFNPETQQTARSATGSFYTPREIVDYMVEESLKNHIKTKVPRMTEAWLTELFDKTAAAEKRELPFDGDVATEIREALYSCKILDPACGSGAFPMGILHCMVRLFGRLDPSNTDLNKRLILRYKQETNLPRDPSYTEPEWQERQEQLKVQLAEGQHYPDYARKLYLIENCIYGVDIQPIATQISKLRFFISLLCDQLRENWNADGENHGLLSLPNLEAKFVCANTLISLPKTEGELELMSSSKIPRLREKLQENRHRIFAARTFRQKEKLKARDLEIRDEIRDAVKSTLAKPDRELIKVQEEIIAKLRQDRVAFEAPKMVKQKKAVQDDFFAATQPELVFEMVDANKPKRDQIDSQIDFAQRKINSELAKSSAANVTKIDQLAEMVSGWDPYDQNASSKFFDPEWMFNINDGFDVVIGNPPYVKLETIKDQSRLLESEGYEVFEKRSDLYCIFTERGIKLLSDGGVISYIMSNKWMQAEYGMPLRRLMLKHRILSLIDFGDIQIFEGATTYPCIFAMKKSEPLQFLVAAPLTHYSIGHFIDDVFCASLRYPVEKLTSDAWVLDYRDVVVLEKIAANCESLSEHINGGAYYGIKPGATEAFIVPADVANGLIKEHRSSKKILVPILRGRDMNRWFSKFTGWYMIGTFPALNLNIDDYPAIKRFLLSYGEKRLEQSGEKGSRKKTANKWFETQDQIAYHKIFKQPKIMYQKFQVKPCFIYDETGLYCNDSMWIIPTDDIGLVGLLNSKMGWWLISKYCTQIQNGYQLIWQYLGKIPVPKKLPPNLGGLVEGVIAAKKKDPNADTSALESQIDQLVYKLYGLTEEEIAIVEGRGEKVKGGGEGEEGGEAKPRRCKARLPAAAIKALHSDDDEELE